MPTMPRLSVNDIFESYIARYGQDHVHQQPRTPFSGRAGHHYFVNRRVSNEHLARITSLSGNAEATLLRMNDAYIVSIGNTGVATATIAVPPRNQGIDIYLWIAHTHPLEQEDRYQRIARGPTDSDHIALSQINRRGWEQNESLIIVCRGGRIVEIVNFERDRPLHDLRIRR